MLVDRLRNGIDVVEIKHQFGPVATSRLDSAPLPDAVASPTRAASPPIYAPNPIGRIPVVPNRPPAEPPPAPIENYPHVTNLGTLLDVLA